MTLLDSSSSASVAADGHVGPASATERPACTQWLREQSTEPGQIEATNRQRLFTPLDVEPGLVAVDAELDGDTLTVVFSGRPSLPAVGRCAHATARLGRRPGGATRPIAWAPGAAPFPTAPGRRSPEASTNPASPRPPSTSLATSPGTASSSFATRQRPKAPSPRLRTTSATSPATTSAGCSTSATNQSRPISPTPRSS